MRMTGSTHLGVAVDLDFLKPFKASNVTTFDLVPSGDATDVTWTMTGTRSAIMGLMGKLFFDKAIAKDFDQGLAPSSARPSGRLTAAALARESLSDSRGEPRAPPAPGSCSESLATRWQGSGRGGRRRCWATERPQVPRRPDRRSRGCGRSRRVSVPGLCWRYEAPDRGRAGVRRGVEAMDST